MNKADEQAASDYYTLLGTCIRELNKAHKGIRRLVRRNRKLAEQVEAFRRRAESAEHDLFAERMRDKDHD